ncbi:MAG: CAP domain-containing protein [Bacteroidia bacterium]
MTTYKTKINEYEPKFIAVLEKSAPIDKVIWDENLALNCKQMVEGTLNPEYKGVNKMCGFAYGSGNGYSNENALYFLCDSYTHILNEDELYFGFYISSKGHAFTWGESCEAKRYVFELKDAIDSSKVDFRKISTAANETGINAMDKEMIKEINFVRQYPQVYASIVADYLSDRSKYWGGLSKDDYEAGNELIEELKVMTPVQILFPQKCVYEAAKKHGEDCKKRGFLDHTGSDGSSPFSRISSFCSGLSGNENIVGGTKDARTLVIELLIDSGISSRGHRYNMLDPDWKYVGCYGYDGGDMYNYIQNFATD